MKTSSEHILTSHAGSLPRPDDLIAGWGSNVEPALAATLASSVKDVVRRQKAIGIDAFLGQHQLPKNRQDGRMFGPEILQPLGAGFLGQVEPLIEQARQCRPRFRIEFHRLRVHHTGEVR